MLLQISCPGCHLPNFIVFTARKKKVRNAYACLMRFQPAKAIIRDEDSKGGERGAFQGVVEQMALS